MTNSSGRAGISHCSANFLINLSTKISEPKDPMYVFILICIKFSKCTKNIIISIHKTDILKDAIKTETALAGSDFYPQESV